MPSVVSPMLCTLLREPFSSDDYVYELKLDGYRIISFMQRSKVVMASRSGLNYTPKYPPVAEALKKLIQEVDVNNDKKIDF